ncbi:MAG: CRISPR-associated protein Cas4 [Verrucomicrobia bacterium]|nr:CRISPR-associated protein Cas4 [Verrucomicrobiota bacterium]
MEIIQLSLINDYLFCPRRAGLKLVEGIRSANVHTVKGDQVHEHADLPGYENAKGTQVWRALPVWSKRLGLSGKCDIVEVRFTLHARGSPKTIQSLHPVEYKKGKRRKFDNDDAQLCAQALCLEEMFGLDIPAGAIFHAASQRRREVEFTDELRAKTKAAITAIHQLLQTQTTPPAVHKPQCAECSLYESCLPEFTSQPPALAKANQALFATDD